MTGSGRERGAAGAGSAEGASAPERHYWSENLRILAILLSVWFVVSFVLGIVLVEPLNQFRLGGFPLGFWISQQGSIFAFVLLVLIYVLWIERVERRFWERKDDSRG